MKVTYRQAAQSDVTRQFRYYLVTLDLPHVAMRFKEAVRKTVQEISKHPLVAPPYGLDNPHLQNLRSWPVDGFGAIHIYFVSDDHAMRVIRVLHGRRNVGQILELERTD